jgi:hypothetical protein
MIHIHNSFISWSLLFCNECKNEKAKVKYNQIKNKFHNIPTSSENAANTKSLCASGINQNFCNHLPYHFHRNHHHQTDINACCVCRQIHLLFGSTVLSRK